MGQEPESITVGIISGWDGEERCAGAWGWWTLWLWHSGDILVKLLGDRFDPASRVSASRSRFHSRSRRHHEDADCFADAITELCHVGYPQNSPELRQELISEQFVRGQVHSSQFVPDTLPIDNRYWQSHIATYTYFNCSTGTCWTAVAGTCLFIFFVFNFMSLHKIIDICALDNLITSRFFYYLGC